MLSHPIVQDVGVVPSDDHLLLVEIHLSRTSNVRGLVNLSAVNPPSVIVTL